MAKQIRVQPEGPDAMRAEIEHTRARMSATIDEIEEVIVQKKHKLEEALDIVARIREQPMKAAGIVFGVGLLMGFLTGGGSKVDEDDLEEADQRTAIWEERARRLLAIARTQEEEIDALDRALYEAESRQLQEDLYEEEFEEDWEEEAGEEWEEEPSRAAGIRRAAASRLAAAAATAGGRLGPFRG